MVQAVHSGGVQAVQNDAVYSCAVQEIQCGAGSTVQSRIIQEGHNGNDQGNLSVKVHIIDYFSVRSKQCYFLYYFQNICLCIDFFQKRLKKL